MKFKLANRDINFDVDHYVSEEGKWEIGIHRVIFGRRVRLGQVGSRGVVLDYCAGDDLPFAFRILTCVMGVLTKVPEDTPAFIVEALWPGYHIKPINKDPTCWTKLQEMYDKTWRGTRRGPGGADIAPPPEWYRARIEHLRQQPPPTPEEVQRQMSATVPYEERFEELGNFVR